MPIKASIVLATRNHAEMLRRTLESIFCQRVPFKFEVVITDDGSTDSTPNVLDEYPVRRFRLEKGEYGNPTRALNNSMKEARGEVLIKQSDDVVHAQPNLIQQLVEFLTPGKIIFASAQDWDVKAGYVNQKEHVGPHNQYPLFFLGACWRKDICKVGGYDEQLFADCFYNHDTWLSDCLISGLGLAAEYLPLLGLHQSHEHPYHDYSHDKIVYDSAVAKGCFQSSSGSWPYQDGVSVNEILRGGL